MADRSKAALVAVLAALAAAAPAQAASVSVTTPHCAPEQSKYGACYPDEAAFKADRGEANRVTITRAVDPPAFQPKVTLTDTGAPLRAGGGCTQVDDHTATCSGYNVVATVDAGDGDDVVEGPGTLDGGAGNDVLKGTYILIGGPGDDRLEGGDQGEYLQGGPGSDTLLGGPGNDTLAPDSGEAGQQDTVDGGDGVDLVSYQDRKDALQVSLQQPFAGEDRLTAVEGIRGGSGADRLTGDAGPNTLEGGPGNDVLTGGEGNDTISGMEGADAIDGGAGNDMLDSGGDRLAGNRIQCGGGADTVDPGPNTLVGPGCESAETSDAFTTIGLALPQSSLRAPIVSLHHFDCLDRPCAIVMSIVADGGRFKGQLLASRRVAIRRPRQKLPKQLRLRLSSRGVQLVKRAGAVRARIRVVIDDAGDITHGTFVVVLGRS